MSDKPEVVDFDDDSWPDVAMVFLDPPDDETWWAAVTEHAMDDEYRYGLVDTEEPVTYEDGTPVSGIGRASGNYYDPALVAEWVKRHVQPPEWLWWGDGEPEVYADDERSPLVSSAEPREGFRRGAIIRLREEVPDPAGDGARLLLSHAAHLDKTRGGAT